MKNKDTITQKIEQLIKEIEEGKIADEQKVAELKDIKWFIENNL